MIRFIYIFLFLIVGCTAPQPVEEYYSECEPAFINPDNSKADFGLIEFDIIPDLGYSSKSTNKGAAVKSKLWTNGEIPFYFQDWSRAEDGRVTFGFNEEERNLIRPVLEELSLETGLSFIEYDSKESLLENHSNGIFIEPGLFANSSYVGMQGGIQSLRITYDFVPHFIKHEFLHAAGMLHEFTRADRDEHIIVNYNNIPLKYHRQFDIYGGESNYQGNDCGKFDFESIMMYPSYTLAIDPEIPVMTTPKGETWDFNTELSEGDILTIKALYKNEL